MVNVLQEIITYMVLGSAVAVVVLKTLKQFGRKNKADNKTEPFETNHKCSECSAECMLFDSVHSNTLVKKDALCKKADVQSD
jgi:hypothetical protein